MTESIQPTILFIGNAPALAYLLDRYAQRSGRSLRAVQGVPPILEVSAMLPAAVWFASLETLEAFQALNAALTNCDYPLVVCSSVADEVRARDLGADHCLLHPVTYEDFLNALAATGDAPARDQATKMPAG